MGRKSREKRERQEAKAAERAAREAKIARSMELGCLFCKAQLGPFKSVEHIVSESLGNTELILPAGVVCDPCNNGRLAPLDQALGDFLPISVLKTFNGIPSKARKLPKVRFINGAVEHTTPGHVFLQLDSARWQTPRDNGFSFTAQKAQWTPKHVAPVAQALLKMALECAWLDLCPDEVQEQKFDHVRKGVLDGIEHGYLTILRNGTPDPRVQVSFWPLEIDGVFGVAVAFNFLGIYMGTHSKDAVPRGDLPEDVVLTLTF